MLRRLHLPHCNSSVLAAAAPPIASGVRLLSCTCGVCLAAGCHPQCKVFGGFSVHKCVDGCHADGTSNPVSNGSCRQQQDIGATLSIRLATMCLHAYNVVNKLAYLCHALHLAASAYLLCDAMHMPSSAASCVPRWLLNLWLPVAHARHAALHGIIVRCKRHW